MSALSSVPTSGPAAFYPIGLDCGPDPKLPWIGSCGGGREWWGQVPPQTGRQSWLLRPACPLPTTQAYRRRLHQLLQALHQKLAALGQAPESLLGSDKPVSYRTKPPASIHRELLSVCSDPYVLAQQLTHVELVSSPMPPSPRPRAGDS